MTLLTCLFGLGFAIQLGRAESRGESVARLYARRLGVLLGIGVLHLVVLWWGDVTWQYALVGFALLLFRRTPPRRLLLWALPLVIVPQLVTAIPAVRGVLQDVLPQPADRSAYNAALVAALRGTSYAAVIAAHLVHVGYHLSRIVVWYLPWLLGRFLLGAYAGRRGLFDREGAAHVPVFRRLLVGGLVVGALGIVTPVAGRLGWLDRYELALAAKLGLVALGELTTLGLAAAYASAVVLLFQRPRWRRCLLVVAPAGRMPLTTYLTQSVAGCFVYYGWGLGLLGKIGAASSLAIAVLVFSLQVLAATLWLRVFRFGPVEWLWRWLAYGRRPSMR